jgi:hypothetical protein
VHIAQFLRGGQPAIPQFRRQRVHLADLDDRKAAHRCHHGKQDCEGQQKSGRDSDTQVWSPQGVLPLGEQ